MKIDANKKENLKKMVEKYKNTFSFNRPDI